MDAVDLELWLFGLGPFVAGDLGCGGCGGAVLVSFYFREMSVVESQTTRCWAFAMDVSWTRGGYRSYVTPVGFCATGGPVD